MERNFESVQQITSKASIANQQGQGAKIKIPLKNQEKLIKLLALQLPKGMQLGKAYDQGDSFFDALAQLLNRINNTDLNTIKYLRDLCHNFYIHNKALVDQWNASEYGGLEGRDDYSYVQYTAEECEQRFNERAPIWGRPNVEGKILCRQLQLEAICVIEILEDPETHKRIPSFHVVTQDNYKSIPEEEAKSWLNNSKIPAIIVEHKSLHFLPLFNISAVQNQHQTMPQPIRKDSQESSHSDLKYKDAVDTLKLESTTRKNYEPSLTLAPKKKKQHLNKSNLPNDKQHALYEKIKSKTLKHLQSTEPDFGEYHGFYVPILGKRLESKDNETDLANLLQTHFLTKDTVGSALVVGASGAGKTSFSRQWVKQCWAESQYQAKPLIALWIPLLSIEQPKANLLAKHLENNLNLTKAEIQAFLQTPIQLLVCCDGYDELNTQDNLYPTEVGKHIELKVLYTCRPEVLEHQRNYRLSFNPPPTSHKQLLEYEVVPFQAAQRQTFIEQYLEHNQALLPEALEEQPNWREAATYLNYLNQLPEVNQFLSHPFALLMALQALPQIVQEQSANLNFNDSNTNTDQASVLTEKQLTLTRHKIYNAFIDKWWDWQIKKVEVRKELQLLIEALQDEIHSRQAKKQQKGQAIDPAEDNYPETADKQMKWLKDELNHFTRKLALAMFQRKVNEVTWQEEVAPITAKFTLASLASTENKSQAAWQGRYFGNKPNLKLIRSCLPLQHLGSHTYAFLHKSLLEYFAAEQLFNSVIVSVWAELGKNLDAICLVNTHESETRQLLVEQVKNSSAFEQALWEIIELSKSEPRIWRAAANAMTLLNLAKKPFSSKDLRRVHIGGEAGEERWGADLSHAILDSVDLSDADLRYVRLNHSWLAQAKLNRAIMLGVEFSELPWLRGELSCYSPDGQWLAVIEEDVKNIFTTKIALYDTKDYHLIRRFNALHKESINCLCFSPDSLQLVSGSSDKTIRLWDVQTGQCQQILKGHNALVTSVSYCPDRLQLASGSWDGTIRLWNIQTGQCQILKGHLKSEIIINYRPDGLQLASSNYNNSLFHSNLDDFAIRLWDVTTGQCHQVLKGHIDWVTSISYHPNGLHLASGSADCTIRIWDTQTGQCQQVLRGHNDRLTRVSYRPDGLQLASGSWDKTIRLWDVQTGECQQVLKGHTNWVKNVSYSPNGLYLSSVCHDQTIRLWGIQTEYSRQVLQGHTNWVMNVSYRPDGLQLASGSWDKTIRLWDVQTGQCQHVLEGHSFSVNSISYQPDGLQLASGSTDKTIRLWDNQTGQCQHVFQENTESVQIVSYHPYRLQLASANARNIAKLSRSFLDYAIMIWDLTTRQCQQLLIGHTNWVRSVSYRPDGLQLASGGQDNTVRLWDLSSGKCLLVLKGHKNYITCVNYRPDGLQLASCSIDKKIRLWDVQTGHCQQVLRGHTDNVYNVSYHPNSLQLASAASDHTIRLWNIKTSKCLLIVYCNSTITSLSWFPSRKGESVNAYYLTAGFEDGTIKTWQIKSIENQILYQLVASYPTVYALNSYQLELQGVIGLNESNYQLLQQRGGNTVKGQPSKASPQQVIEQRNQQKYVPSGTITVKGESSIFTITPQHWLISLVREKSNYFAASSQSSTADGHVYLILQGLDEQHYTLVKEFHLYLNTQKSTLFNALGTGVIKIHDSSPWLLKEKQERLIARQWMISCNAAQALIERIEQQQKSKAPSYSVSGKGGHNCLSWCAKQLEDADIPIDKQPTWRSFICAVPSDYLPEATQANNNNQDRNCLVM